MNSECSFTHVCTRLGRPASPYRIHPCTRPLASPFLPRPEYAHNLLHSIDKRSSQTGFTLIELLVVVSIIAIAFTAFITLGFSFSNPEDDLDEEIRRLQARLDFAHEQGITRSEDYGVRFNSHSYRFMRLKKDLWVDIDDDKLLLPRELAENISVELELDKLKVVLTNQDEPPADDNPENQIKPQVFLLSSGETTPDFEVRLRVTGQDISRAMHGDIIGQYTLLKAGD